MVRSSGSADGPAARHTLASLGLISDTASASVGTHASIKGLALASHAVQDGYLFAALPGTVTHGARYAVDASERGAVAVLTDSDGESLIRSASTPVTIPIITVADPRSTLAALAARWYGQAPGTLVAVTGTNGKTSVVDMCRQIWEHQGCEAATLGTTGITGRCSAGTGLTTPDPLTLHRHLHAMSRAGVTHLAMEASSHGLDQARLDGLRFDAAAFTNLSHDHLDYHGTVEAYRAAKQILFTRLLSDDGTAVLWMDDPHSQSMLKAVRSRNDRIIKVGCEVGDLRIISIRPTYTGQDIRFAWRGAPYECRLDLLGGFQIHNLLVAVAMTIATGLEPESAFSSLESIRAVPGRMDCVAQRANRSTLIVDFAHTPAALKSVLKELRRHFRGDLHLVFGAGGDRDKEKRVLMGRVAARHADHVTVTDDNPRHERSSDIRAAILAGCPEADEIPDRAEAILCSAARLGPGDVLLIAGKGHETGQIIGDTVIPFDDREQASMAARLLDGKAV
ncbi:MAG: UDP-N-acetylmuramoyl-L-alanyl-D-glutamate--2,6-diaminopimelate ligase [Rhodobacteraceae bacterium]|nr:UDP-N-acetylmuramoyl-L-alanyl-D-glutamate--2,6-diaminopimelate ligase [Paracoccaceae bacterium]